MGKCWSGNGPLVLAWGGRVEQDDILRPIGNRIGNRPSHAFGGAGCQPVCVNASRRYLRCGSVRSKKRASSLIPAEAVCR